MICEARFPPHQRSVPSPRSTERAPRPRTTLKQPVAFSVESCAPARTGPAPLASFSRALAQHAAKPLASSAGSATGSWRFLRTTLALHCPENSPTIASPDRAYGIPSPDSCRRLRQALGLCPEGRPLCASGLPQMREPHPPDRGPAIRDRKSVV